MFFANGRPLQHKRGLVAKSRFESWPQRILYLRGHSESECRGKVRQVPLHGRNIKSNHWAQQLCSKWLRLHLLQAVIWPKLPLKALVNLYPELFFVLFVCITPSRGKNPVSTWGENTNRQEYVPWQEINVFLRESSNVSSMNSSMRGASKYFLPDSAQCTVCLKTIFRFWSNHTP